MVVSGFSVRFVFLMSVLVLVAAGLVAGDGAIGKAAKKPKLGKEGSYAQVFKNGTSLEADDTSVAVFTRNRRVVAVWVASNYKFDGGAACWPIGFTGALMPDGTTTGPVSVQVHPKKPTALNAKNGFTIKASKSNPFYDNGGGSITGKLLPSGRMSVTVKLSQAANSFQGRCSTVFKAPKAKFEGFKVSTEIG